VSGAPGPLLRGARYVAVAWEFVGTIAAGAVIGWFLDDRLGWAPSGIMVCTVTAVAGAFVRLIQTLRRFDRVDGKRQP
jgi:F0F1-type ATP synthase assembly protein I